MLVISLACTALAIALHGVVPFAVLIHPERHSCPMADHSDIDDEIAVFESNPRWRDWLCLGPGLTMTRMP